MLLGLLLLWCACIAVVPGSVLLDKEVSVAIKDGLDKDVGKLGTAKKTANKDDIVLMLLKEMKAADAKREYHTDEQVTDKKMTKEAEDTTQDEELLQLLLQAATTSHGKPNSVQNDELPKKKESIDEVARAEKVLQDSIQKEIEAEKKDEELLRLLASTTSRSNDDTKTTTTDSTSKRELSKDIAAQSEKLLDESMKEAMEKKSKDADKELMQAIIDAFQRNKRRSENEELVQALLRNQKQIRKEETSQGFADLNLDLNMLSKKNFDTKRAILDTFIYRAVKEKDAPKKSEVGTKKTDSPSFDSLLKDITDVQEKGKGASNKVLEDLIKLVDIKKKELQLTSLENVLKGTDGEKADVEKKEEDCRDEVSHCESLVSFCDTHKEELAQKCRKTCNLCRCRVDVWRKETCQRLEKLGYCESDEYKEKSKIYCYKTCGHCRVPSPPACQMHPQGCCWDKVSFASEGCPVCEDNYRVGKICKTFRDVCNSTGNPGRYMKKHCPVSCGFCDPHKECMNYHEGHPCETVKHLASCKDSSGDDRCRVWKQTNVCGMFKDLAEKWCFKTCFNCHHVHSAPKGAHIEQNNV